MCLCHQLGLKTPASWRNGTSFFEKPPTFLPLSGGLTDFFTSSNRYSGRLRSYIGRICTPFAYLAGLYVLLAPSKSAIFVDFGAENGQIWPLETGYGRNPPTNRCFVFTGDYGRDVWPLVDPLTPYLRYPISAPVIRRFVWGNALRGGQSRGGASNGQTKTVRVRS